MGTTTRVPNLIPGDSSFETEATKSCVRNSRQGTVTWTIDNIEKYDGRQSLKLCFPKLNAMVFGAPFLISAKQIKGGSIFTLSVYAKADQDGVGAKLYLLQPDDLSPVIQKEIRLTSEWGRYALSGKLEPRKYCIAFEAFPSNSCSVWVDAYQFENGDKPTVYHNCANNFGILIPSEYGSVFFPDEPVKVRLQALFQGES